MAAVDVSPWLRPDANACADRTFGHTFGQGEGKHRVLPSWPYSAGAALETGRASWIAVPGAVRWKPVPTSRWQVTRTVAAADR
ncbi:hypothetical protein [Streptomyces antibioticus]|uniref:hypothetical protein n=1 Tax=Streptomyces antibioticus TaxID=1890 RepID=UPI003F4D6BE5